MAPTHESEFLPEVWSLCGIGTAWLLLRFIVRIRMAGLRGLDFADACALVALAAWVYTAAILQYSYEIGTNLAYTTEDIEGFDQSFRDKLVYNSKLFFGSWYAYIALVFSLKGIVIMLYRKIIVKKWQRIVFNTTIFLCVGGFIGITLAITLICLPIRQRWQLIPVPPPTCTASSSVLISLACINAFTDTLLISIPVPLLWTLKVPLAKRIGIFILLSSGIFVLAACILRVSLTAVPGTSVLVIARWGIREIFVAIITVNAAAIRPILRPSFWTSTPPSHRRSSTPPAHQRPHYLMPQPFSRLAARISRRAAGNQALDSTSAGDSTIHAWNEAEFGGREYVLEDPDVRVDSTMMSGGSSGARRKAAVRQGQGDGDGDGELDGTQRSMGRGRAFFNALWSFGRSDLGSGWTGRRNEGDTTTGAESATGGTGNGRTAERERDLEKGEVCRTEVLHGSKSGDASGSGSLRQNDEVERAKTSEHGTRKKGTDDEKNGEFDEKGGK